MPSLPRGVDYWYAEATVQLNGCEYILRINDHDREGYYAAVWLSPARCDREEALAIIPASDFEPRESIDDIIDRLVGMIVA